MNKTIPQKEYLVQFFSEKHWSDVKPWTGMFTPTNGTLKEAQWLTITRRWCEVFFEGLFENSVVRGPFFVNQAVLWLSLVFRGRIDNAGLTVLSNQSLIV